MSGKLDQSLDQIMQDSKPAGGRGRRAGRKPPARRAATKAKAAIAAPTGGVQKNRANAKTTTTAPTGPAIPASGESKIIVSNLPEDVTETQIKDYFSKTIGQVKRVMLTYGPTGKSRGTATIVFHRPESGAQAAKQLNGVKVDNRAMKIEVVLGASQAPAPPAPKGLADRVSQPKSAAKQKDKTKPKANGAAPAVAVANGAAKGKGGRNEKKSGRAGRPKKKTAEELDAEMMDYFGGDAGAANGAAVQPAAAVATNDTGMVDEVL